jgi:hypothetical protein
VTKLQKITVENLEGRIETGPLQINDDWPGTFIRGDNAAYYAMMLGQLLAVHEEQNTDYEAFGDSIAWAVMKSLHEDLTGSNVLNLKKNIVEDSEEDVGC